MITSVFSALEAFAVMRYKLIIDIDIDIDNWETTPVLGDPNVTAFLEVLSLHRFC